MLVLGNEQFMRKMDFGYNWNRIRILLRCCVYGTYSFNSFFGIGICSGFNQYNSSTSDMLIYGVNTQPSILDYKLWSRIGTSQFVASTTLCYVGSKVGNTAANGTAGQLSSGQTVWTPLGMYPNRMLICVDFIRSGSSFTGRAWGKESGTSSTTYTDVDQTTFFYDAESLTPSSITSGFMPNGTTSYAGGSGLLDTLWISWGAVTPVLLISDLVVCRHT